MNGNSGYEAALWKGDGNEKDKENIYTSSSGAGLAFVANSAFTVNQLDNNE
jgi:hypothetical protein